MKPIAIVLNGASSAGKTSIAKAMQQLWPSPLIHASLDSFTDVFAWSAIQSKEAREQCHAFGVQSFHSYLSTIADSDYPIVIDHVFEQKSWFESTRDALHQRATFFVAVRCDLPILEDRERKRGNRRLGLARRQHEIVHKSMNYDLEVDTNNLSSMDCAKLVIEMATKNSPRSLDR